MPRPSAGRTQALRAPGAGSTCSFQSPTPAGASVSASRATGVHVNPMHVRPAVDPHGVVVHELVADGRHSVVRVAGRVERQDTTSPSRQYRTQRRRAKAPASAITGPSSPSAT